MKTRNTQNKTFKIIVEKQKSYCLIKKNKRNIYKKSLNNINSSLRTQGACGRLVIIGIIGKERDPGVGKLGWHGNFDMGFERNICYFVQNPVCGFF